MFRLGVDLGGTKIEGVALDPQGREIFRKRVPTPQADGYEAILGSIRDLYEDLVREICGAEHTLGVGTPGALSRRTGCLKNSNTVCLNGRPLLKDLTEKLGRPPAIQNDANCFAMAEALFGAGRGKELVFGVILGTGCGGGIVFQGKVFEGLQAIAGEWGHMTIDPSGPECYCGARGCVETLISGGGAERRFETLRREKRGEGRRKTEPGAFSADARKTFQEIVADYRAGEPIAVQFMETYFQNFGRALANVVNLLDPDLIVLGGGVSHVGELYTKGVEAVRGEVFSDSLETPIVKNELGDSAGVLGAAWIGI